MSSVAAATVLANVTVRKCSFCAEEILADAKKCKHCGEFVNATLSRGVGAIFAEELLLLASWLACSPRLPKAFSPLAYERFSRSCLREFSAADQIAQSAQNMPDAIRP
jgi:hypothetical protein